MLETRVRGVMLAGVRPFRMPTGSRTSMAAHGRDAARADPTRVAALAIGTMRASPQDRLCMGRMCA